MSPDPGLYSLVVCGRLVRVEVSAIGDIVYFTHTLVVIYDAVSTHAHGHMLQNNGIRKPSQDTTSVIVEFNLQQGNNE